MLPSVVDSDGQPSQCCRSPLRSSPSIPVPSDPPLSWVGDWGSVRIRHASHTVEYQSTPGDQSSKRNLNFFGSTLGVDCGGSCASGGWVGGIDPFSQFRRGLARAGRS